MTHSVFYKRRFSLLITFELRLRCSYNKYFRNHPNHRFEATVMKQTTTTFKIENRSGRLRRSELTKFGKTVDVRQTVLRNDNCTIVIAVRGTATT